MSSLPTDTLGALHKVARKGVQKIKCESLKPPEQILDESGAEQHKFIAVYVSGGREFRESCTQAVWKKILGPAAAPGRKVPGLDNKVYCEFFIVKDKGMVIGVDIMPENRYERGNVPEEIKDQKEVRIRFTPKTGEVEVTQIPPKFRTTRLHALLSAIDVLETIAPGDEIAGCEVTQVAGNQVVLEPMDLQG